MYAKYIKTNQTKSNPSECILGKPIGAQHIRHRLVRAPELHNSRHVDGGAEEHHHELVQIVQGSLPPVVHVVAFVALSNYKGKQRNIMN